MLENKAIANISLLTIAFVFTAIFFFASKAVGNEKNDFCLKKSYEVYKKEFMSTDGRIMDPEKNNITTSEGQSYMMLKSVIIGDRPTFDLVYKWTKDNLQRKDNLFAWLWGNDGSGKYKILDYNTASDADVDIAFALILAYEKFDDFQYLQEAVPIANSIWNNETKQIGNYTVLMPGVQQTSDAKVEINPSYFSPYAFRYFQKYDELHEWNYLIDSSYYYLNAVMAKTKTGLPPNWFLIDDQGEIVFENSERSDFSYDAIRVFARVYLDYVRTGEQRALPILDKANFFVQKWKDTGHLYVNYKEDRELRDKSEFVGSMAILIPVISVYDKKTAAEMYDKKIKPYIEDKKYWEEKRDYYGKNLLWFGCYMYNTDTNEYKNMHKKRIKDNENK